MTLEELDDFLKKTNLDLNNPADMEIRNKILALHGKSMIDAKQIRCNNCWYKDNGRCNPACDLFGVTDDPIEASKAYLARRNNIQLFSFVFMYVFPVYEEVTGNKNVRKEFTKKIQERWRKEHPDFKPSKYI